MSHPRSRIFAAVISLAAIGLLASALVPALAGSADQAVQARKRPPSPTPTASPRPDFRLDYATYGYTDLGYVVRGGLAGCELCVGSWEPRFIDRSGESCFYGSSSFELTSLNGFEGTVLIGTSSTSPKGVTSEIPPSVFLPRGGTALVPFKLRAASDASGFGLVLVQAIGKGGTTPTHSVYHEVWVVDQLPPCQ